MFPQEISYCTPLGNEHIDSYKYLVIHEDRLQTIPSGFRDGPRPWFVDDEFVSIIKPTVDVLNELLGRGISSEFQQKVLDAVLLYSRNSLVKEPADRLVYILVALESILLKNENEPIMQNIGERMAFFIGRSVEEKKLIIDRLKKVYGLRSSFIHHGHSVRDLEVLKEFMFYAWEFFQNLILNMNRFATKIDFINKIEEVKLS